MRLSDLKPKYGAAYKQIAIKGVKDGIVSLEDYTYVAIYETSSVNFELKSENEQDALIENFRSFLNGLDDSLQILIRTREINLDSIQERINEHLRQENNSIFRRQLNNYAEFIKSLVKDNRILTRRFYLAIRYKGNSKTDQETAKEQLAIKSDIITKGLQRLGMSVSQLSDLSVLNLFYSFYNPDASKIRPISEELLVAIKPHIERGINENR